MACSMEVLGRGSRIIYAPEPAGEAVEMPLTIFDRLTWNRHYAIILATTAPAPDNDALIAGLTKALTVFTTLAARLGHDGHRPCILMGGEHTANGGALVVEAEVAKELTSFLPLKPTPEILKLHPPLEEAEKVFQVQLTRFACGGLVIATTTHHCLADGQSLSNFLTCWSRFVRGLPVSFPSNVYDRSWLVPRSNPHCDFDHWPESDDVAGGAPRVEAVASDIENLLLHFPVEFIVKLKAMVNQKFTTFETLLAHLWRKVTIARGLDDGTTTEAIISVNGRRRLKRAVPAEYFGNIVLFARPTITAGALLAGGTARAASVIHDAVSSIDEGYIRSLIDFGEIYGDRELLCSEMEGTMRSPALEVDNWLRSNVHVKYVFGGKLCGFLPSWEAVERLMVFLPAYDRDDGGAGVVVNVVVTLLKEHAKVMTEIAHSLDYLHRPSIHTNKMSRL